MKSLVGMVLSVLALMACMSLARADDATPAAKEVTLKGTLLCAKCSLHEEGAKCQNVLKVKEGETETLYYLAPNDVSKDKHGDVCHGPKENVTVTGSVEEKDGKKVLTATKIDMG